MAKEEKRKLTEDDLNKCELIGIRVNDWTAFKKAMEKIGAEFVELDKDKYHTACPRCGESESWNGCSCGNCGFVYGETEIPY